MKQLGDYDIYIGIMGTRFGSPSGPYGSGTEREFMDAIELFEQQKILKVSFFFKDTQLSTAELNADSIDQLRKVDEFKSRIGPRGLYAGFRHDHELSNSIQKLVCGAIDDDLGAKEPSQHQYTIHMPAASGEPTISKFFFSGALDQLDEELTNGTRTRLTLEDVWIAPSLREITSDATSHQLRGKPYDITALLSDLKSGNGVLITGEEKAGKTCLCRHAYVALYKDGYLPVIVSVDKLNNPHPQRLINRAWTSYVSQYENLNHQNFQNLPNDRTILIVDDFDRARLNPKHSANILLAARNHFHAVLITASPLFMLDELAAPTVVVGAFKRVEIREIGHVKRYELIERWCLAGQLNQSTESDFRNSVERKRNVINEILRTNLVPRTPMTVLILLQAIDAGQAGDLARTGFVRYYKFLIDSAILRSASAEEAELSYALLPEIAWTMYTTRSDSLSPDQTEAIIENVAERKALRKTDLYSALHKLHELGMFDEKFVGTKFRQKYAYYFFLGDYISRRINDDEMVREIKSMCERIGEREIAHALVFLSFHTDNELIVDALLRKLSVCFATARRFEFSAEQTSPVNQLIYEAPKHVVDAARLEANRRERLTRADVLAESQTKDVEVDEASPSDLHVTFTAIGILGHVIRNHYARLDATTKKRIFNETTNAALRCLGSVFDSLSKSLEKLQEVISSISERPSGEEGGLKPQTEMEIRKLIFFLVAAVLYYSIDRISRSVGDETLEIVYRQAVENSPEKIRKLIELAIKVTCFREFPLNDLRKLAGDLKNDSLGLTVLRLFVIERLDMRPPTGDRDLQRICDAAGLALVPRLIERQRASKI